MEEKRCYGCMKIKKTEGVCPFCGYDDSIPNEAHQLPAGTILQEQYLIGKVLGQGGFGITYMGWDMYLNIPVAIKEYFPSGSVMRNCHETTDVISYSGETGVRFRNNKERFMREVKMLARFSNTREIVQVKTFFLANNTAYIVMEYVDGITLKEYVKGKGGKLEAQQVLNLVRPVMEALAKVHKAGLVHRDISPDNIMILPDGSVKLLDFGAVRDVGGAEPGKALTKSTEAILKQGYAPIEQYQSHGSLGPWTDVYAFCATLYYCFTGEVPPDAPERILGEELISFQDKGVEISHHIEKVLYKGLALKISDRIADMEELCRMLFDENEADEEEAEEIIESDDKGEEDPMDSEKDTDIGRTEEADEEIVSEAQDTMDEQVPSDENTAIVSGEEEKKKGTGNKKKWIIVAAAAICVIGLLIYALAVSTGKDSDKNTEDQSSSSAVAQEKRELESAEARGKYVGNSLREGQCGDSVTYTLDIVNGDMVLSGTGETWGFRLGEPWESPDAEQPYDAEVPWMEERDKIKSLRIEDGVTTIGSSMFADCVNLTTVEWGQVEEIWPSAFRNTGLTQVVLPDSVRHVHDFAFGDCGNLTEVVIGNGAELVNIGAFDVENLQSVTLNDHVVLEEREWEDGMETPFFHSNYPKENLVIYANTGSTAEEFAAKYHVPFVSLGFAEGYTLNGQCGDDVYWELDLNAGRIVLSGSGRSWDYVGGMDPEDNPGMPLGWPEWYAYRNYIRELVVEPGVTRIGHCLFNLCRNLNCVDLGTVEEFGVCSFAESGLTHVVLPETTREVNDYAFVGCSQLEEITFPESVTGVWGAFTWCDNLRSFTVLGKDTVFYTNPGDHGIFMEYDEEPNGKSENVVVYGWRGSYAEAIAHEEGIPFVALDEE